MNDLISTLAARITEADYITMTRAELVELHEINKREYGHKCPAPDNAPYGMFMGKTIVLGGDT